MKGLIIVNGDAFKHSLFSNIINEFDRIYCADGGANHAFKMGIIPDYIIGDLDSIEDDVLSFYDEKGVRIEKYKSEKDYTDTELCVQKAIEDGCNEICMIAGIGNRIDHSLGNIGLLHYMNSNGIKGYIETENSSIYLCSNEIEIDGEIGDTLSIIPFRGDAKGISLEGLKYPLNNARIDFGRPLGISNKLMENKCKVSIKEGEILVIKVRGI